MVRNYHLGQIAYRYRSSILELIKNRDHCDFLAGLMFFELISPVMEINPLRCSLCAITDFVLFCETDIDVRSGFPRNIIFQTSVVFLAIHDTLLTARGRRAFFFAMVSKAVDTM